MSASARRRSKSTRANISSVGVRAYARQPPPVRLGHGAKCCDAEPRRLASGARSRRAARNRRGHGTSAGPPRRRGEFVL